MCTLSSASQRTISLHSSNVSSFMIVTWSESQRTGRETWSITSGVKSSSDESLSATSSVG